MASPTRLLPAISRRRLAALAASAAVLVAGCGTALSLPSDNPPRELGFTSPDPQSVGSTPASTRTPTSGSTTAASTTEPRPSRPPITEVVPIATGSPEAPFAPLPATAQASALISPTGVVLPVAADRTYTAGRPEYLVFTPCAAVRVVTEGTPLHRAHVVLDPGHGGREFGATGEGGLLEKDLNLRVALEAERMLIERGATVVLTRSTDIAMTTSVRATIAREVAPALLVSIHHNGGAPANGDRPGTIVFTKAGNDDAYRFGGLFYRTLTPRLAAIGDAKRDAFSSYADAFVANEEAIAAHDRSVTARVEALVVNGQIDGPAPTPPTTAVSPRDRIDGTETPSVRQPETTTTRPATDPASTVPVPDTVPVPPPLEHERVDEFRWAGSGNAGVRPWVASDGQDILSVLRRAGDVPAAVVEYLYVTNPAEEALLATDELVELEAAALVDSIVEYLTTDNTGSGYIADQVGDEPIGGGGHTGDCVEPDLGFAD